MEAIEKQDLSLKDLYPAEQLEREKYDEYLASIYCQYIMEGKSLMAAAEWVHMSEHPDDEFEVDSTDLDVRAMEKRRLRNAGNVYYKRFLRWRIIFPRFDEMVNLALKQRCYSYVEEMVEIADDATDDAIMGAQGPTINGKAIRRAEIMINTRKFVASKLLPKVFGDKTQMELTGADGKDLVPTTFNIQLVPSGNFIPKTEAERAALEEGGEGDDTSA